jgi:uncharacterized protein YcgI (DUF1989 family)
MNSVGSFALKVSGRTGRSGMSCNCLDNFVAAASLPVVPDPVNVFQNSDPAPDGTLTVDTAASRPGDSASFRAMRDVLVVLTACAVDHWPTNGIRCTPLELQIGPG